MDRLSVIIRSRGSSSSLQLHPESAGVELCSVKGISGVFYFDAVLPVDASQGALYDGHLRKVLNDSLEGQVPVTILAYGQTGAGKTYTMGTNPVLDEDLRGVMPRVIEQVFSEGFSPTEVRASFFEIYNEQIFDLLLASDSERIPLILKEDSYSHFNIPALSSVPVGTYEEAMDALVRGGEHRSSGSTGQNNVSSRSHAIFSLSIKNQEDKEFQINMVDLAGSECLKRTNATGRTLIEGLNINKSLLALGNVIEALCSKKSHIPFRDSVLTKILKECLLSSGSYTVMIACISHQEMDMTDSVNTLRYAHRAKRIRKQNISLKRKYPLKTPRKVQQASLLEVGSASKYHPFKTPGNGSFLNSSRTQWLTSTACKPNPGRFEDVSNYTLSGLSDASLMSNVSECSTGLSPRLRRYKEEFERSLFTTINPLLKEIQDLREQLHSNGKKMRKKPRMTSSPIGLPPNLPGIESSSDEDVTIKPQSIKKGKRASVLRDLTNEETILTKLKCSTTPAKSEDVAISLMAKKLGIDPNSPLLFEETLGMPKKVGQDLPSILVPQVLRRRSVRLLDKVLSRRESGLDQPPCLKKEQPSTVTNRRRSVRLEKKRASIGGPLLHPMHVQENWSIQSQETHNNNVLGILNSGNLKVLQALPAVGPKSAMVIHTHRNLNGPLQSLAQLEDVKGLAKSFFKKFITQNQIVIR